MTRAEVHENAVPRIEAVSLRGGDRQVSAPADVKATARQPGSHTCTIRVKRADGFDCEIVAVGGADDLVKAIGRSVIDETQIDILPEQDTVPGHVDEDN